MSTFQIFFGTELKSVQDEHLFFKDLVGFNNHPNIFFPTFGSHIKKWLDDQNFDTQAQTDQWKILVQARDRMSSGNFEVCTNQLKPVFSLIPCGGKILNSNPLIALNEFYYIYSKEFYLANEKAQVVKLLSKKIKQHQNYLTKSSQKLRDLVEGIHPREIGDVLMANLHLNILNQ